ncbi:TlpA family protein disulfide reductase [Sphingobacterium thalpophilum]|uniref:TlpA family protein disulfide reductase n=1 Tax=Sphingobacterium thalpophilum TaxID=259 RepID=UPI002D7862B1|nr:TlpA disulfide reductase family protein [Sphingobacterium thalpophilum]
MRSIATILILLFSQFKTVQSQTSVTFIINNAKDFKNKEIGLSEYGLEPKFQPIRDTLLFSLGNSVPTFYSFYIADRYFKICLSPGPVVIKGAIETEKFVVDTIINAPLYYERERFIRMVSSGGANDPNHYLKYIKSNIANPLALEAIGAFLFTFQNNREYIDKIYYLYQNDANAYKNSPDIRNFERLSKIRNLTHVEIDKQSLTNLDGARSLISKRRSTDYYLLDFWFVNCPPCVSDHLEIMKDFQFLNGKNVRIIGISIDKKTSDVQSYIDKHHYPWEQYLDENQDLTSLFSITSFPSYILLNSDGKIVLTSNQYKDINSYLRNSR